MMETKHREIAISEFFEKNRHLLGYENKSRALLTIVKECVDNSLDATEEARILPDIYVKVKEVSPEKFEIVIKDNGPGIVKKQIPRVFGKLLYGDKFHRLRQSRGEQGIGVSGAVLYSQLTTGEATEITSSIGDGEIHHYKLKIDVKKNEPIVLDEKIENGNNCHGVEIRFFAEGVYREHKQSVIEYLKQTAVSNPHANIVFDSPAGMVEFKRGSNVMPREPKEMKPHLHGVEIGVFTRMLYETKSRTLASFFMDEFTKIGRQTAKQICEKAGTDPKRKPKSISDEEIKRIVSSLPHVKLLNPPLDCLSPMGEELTSNGLKKEFDPEFVFAVTRPPAVYRGWPFQVETALAYGGSITQSKTVRFANRVPLLYQQGDCAITKSVSEMEWKRYGLENDIDKEPIIILVHLASVWVPFTSESKEAIASYPVIIKEIKLALQECSRRLSLHLSGKRKKMGMEKRKKLFERYSDEIANALHELTGEKKEKINEALMKLVEKNSSIESDQDGNPEET
jgi:DNA topoisomerase-6 subunit B